MANKFQDTIIEPEEMQGDFNPLDEAVNEKRYSQPNINTSDIDLNKPIEEPKFTPPPFQKKETIDAGKKPPPREPMNPEMKNLSKKDTEMAASSMAKLILQGYEWIHDIGNKGLQVSEKKLNKLQANGEINLNAMIDYDYGKKIRAGEFFQEYNQQVSGILKVSDEFKEEVTPVLERVLAKRGIGLTDEQMLMYMFGKDAAAKSIIFFQQKTQINYMIQSIKEATANQFVEQSAPPPPPPPTPERQEVVRQEAPVVPMREETIRDLVVIEPEEYVIDSKPTPTTPDNGGTKKRGRPRR